ncbi:hypothetical protein BGZ60DRAFT_406657 [Tricladium varicosporioides]|nr:hypothetical protein BGZ60DRAFT_406657 [Hymenoscyphus varicosporioides]
MRQQRSSSVSSIAIGLLTIAYLAWGHGVANGAGQKVLIDSSIAQKIDQVDTTSISTVTSSQTLSSITSRTTAMKQVEQSEKDQIFTLNITAGDFGGQDNIDIHELNYDPYPQKEWKDSNFSSDPFIMRHSVVTMPDEDNGEGGVKKGKVYDVDSWKGGPNNQVSVAFYFSTEVGVSAGQRRDGSLFDIVAVEGDDEYKNMMAQMQQHLKGNRSEYYAQPDLDCGLNRGLMAFPLYFKRILQFLRNGPPPPPYPYPYPIFKKMLSNLLGATEASLGLKLNTSSGFYARDSIYLHISAPWEFNHTYALHMRHAMNDLNMTIHHGHYELHAHPSCLWSCHWNDQQDWGGPNGTAMAFQHARTLVEMSVYTGRYQNWCGTADVERWWRKRNEMIANGTWVEPPHRNQVEWRCRSLWQCLRALPWEWNYLDVDWDEL